MALRNEKTQSPVKFFLKFFLPFLAVVLLSAALACFFLSPLITERVVETVAWDWLTPLDTGKRSDWDSLLISKDGHFLYERPAYARLETHIHTGVDLQNRYRGGPGEPVYAVARGKVYDVKLQGKGTRVTLEHLLPNGELVYTSYIHVADVAVAKRMRVDAFTVIARRLNREELHRYGKIYNHLHFQVHKNKFVPEHTIESRTPEEVDARFYNPEAIFHNHYQDAVPDWRAWTKSGKLSFGKLLLFLFW